MLPDDLSGAFVIDVARSRIGFTARHALITKVRGCFTEFAGSTYLDATEPGSSTAELTIQAVSIDTGNAARDAELRTNGFLDVPSHPLITFASTQVGQVAATRFELTGDLTIKAITRSIVVRFELTDASVTDDNTGTELTFVGKTTLNRRDWGVEWPPPLETGGVLVGDKIDVEIAVVARNTQ